MSHGNTARNINEKQALLDSLVFMNATKSIEYTNDTKFRLSSTTKKQTNSETVLNKQKRKIEQQKKINESTNRNITEIDVLNNHGLIIDFLNQTQSTNSLWEYAMFTTQIYKINEEIPIIQNNKFSKVDTITLLKNNLSIRNLIFKSDLQIDYGICNTEINLSFTLKGESTFWLFLHCDENINETTSAVIQINKEEKKNAFINLGVFMDDGEYKIFSKQQLVNFSGNDQKYKHYSENDIILIKMIVFDFGDDNIKIKIFINNSLIENNILGNYFLPVINSKRIYLAGNGEEINLKLFECKLFAKPKYIKQYNISTKKIENSHCAEACGDCIVF